MFKIIKIGGIALGMNDLYRDLKHLLRNNNESYFIVISALKNVSRLLKSASEFAVQGRKTSMEEKMSEVIENHREFISKIFPDAEHKFKDLIAGYNSKLEKLLRSVYVTGHLSHRASDLILASGEDILLDIIKIDLSDNMLVQTIDSREIIRTDSNFGQASPDVETSSNLINSKISQSKALHYITQGFVASDKDGNATTMGFESSNLTAMLIAQAVGANEIRMITDVSGIYNADPKIYSNARLIPEISYKNAVKAADYGLKLFYAPMLKEALESGVTIYYGNAIVHNDELTIVSSNANINNSLIIYKDVTGVQFKNRKEIIHSEQNIIEFSDNSRHFIFKNDNELFLNDTNSLANINDNVILIFLYYELNLIVTCIYENNFDLNEIKLFMPEKDVIHLFTRKEIALKLGEILLARM